MSFWAARSSYGVTLTIARIGIGGKKGWLRSPVGAVAFEQRLARELGNFAVHASRVVMSRIPRRRGGSHGNPPARAASAAELSFTSRIAMGGRAGWVGYGALVRSWVIRRIHGLSEKSFFADPTRHYPLASEERFPKGVFIPIGGKHSRASLISSKPSEKKSC